MLVLELHNVQRSFGGVKAVDGVDLTLAVGESRALIGPNGCGKTTLFELITGALRPDAGRIVLGGAEITGLAPDAIARRGVGRKFQVPALFDSLTVSEHLDIGRWRASDRGAIAANLLERIGLADRAGAVAGTLSHGERQWLAIGMVLSGAPRLLLLDEPTAGMTESETAATVDLIHEVTAGGGTSVVVIEHDLGFLGRIGFPVAVMARGRIVRVGSYADVRADSAVQALYFGEPTVNA
jgi:ABC-type uncharacterized transport system ATPase subunit